MMTKHLGASPAVALFELDRRLILSSYPRHDLAKDAEISTGPATGGVFSLGQLVRSRSQVDQLLETAVAAGVMVTRAGDRPWGIYSGYFRDSDRHVCEIIWNPNSSRPGL